MQVYQIMYYSDKLEDYTPVKGLPLYKTTEMAENIVNFLKYHPENSLVFQVYERWLMESE